MAINGNNALATYNPVLNLTPVAPRHSGTVRFGVVGYGYWGRNVVRNLHTTSGVEISAVCDQNSAARRRVHKTYPHVYVSADASEILTSPDIDTRMRPVVRA